MGLPTGKSILDRWTLPDGSFKYRELCPLKGSTPIVHEEDCRLLAVLMADLFRLDAHREVKESFETDLLLKDGRPLAFFNDTCMYSPLGMFIWMDFWAAGANFGPLSKILHASNRAAIAELAELDFML